MRSTATFDPDVSSRLQKLVARRHQTKKAVLNEVMRLGLDLLENESESKPFVLVPFEATGPLLDQRLPTEIGAELEMQDEIERHNRIMADWAKR